MTAQRINKWLAQATGLSRRAADAAIEAGRVKINGTVATLGQQVGESDQVHFNNHPVASQAYLYLMLNKPKGYVSSRQQQGATPTIYKLLPAHYHRLKPVGRLDKDSSGLLVLTNDGELANLLTHPSQLKVKLYRVRLDRKLTPEAKQRIEQGVELDDGLSRLKLQAADKDWLITMYEGRNRQIRRTFEMLGYEIKELERLKFGKLELGNLKPGEHRLIERGVLA